MNMWKMPSHTKRRRWILTFSRCDHRLINKRIKEHTKCFCVTKYWWRFYSYPLVLRIRGLPSLFTQKCLSRSLKINESNCKMHDNISGDTSFFFYMKHFSCFWKTKLLRFQTLIQNKISFVILKKQRTFFILHFFGSAILSHL